MDNVTIIASEKNWIDTRSAETLEKKLIDLEDKYLAQGKGFDCYSFKKMPGKRKVKSC